MQPWKLEQESPTWGRVFGDMFRSFQRLPALSWISLFVGIVLLIYTQDRSQQPLPPQPTQQLQAQASQQPQGKPQAWHDLFTHFRDDVEKLPWLGLMHEVAMALIISWCLALFLDEPLRSETIRRVGRDIAPFLIAALTVPEMRFKMRQICESAIIRRHAKLTLWITEAALPDPQRNTFTLKVQMRSHYCNISNAKQKIMARIAVDDDKHGKILSMTLRGVQVVGLQDFSWHCDSNAQPPLKAGRRVLQHSVNFPQTDDWESSYIEGTSEYQEEVTLISGVGRTLVESLWPLVGVEIECVRRPGDIRVVADVPFHQIEKVGSDRWISRAALLPGQRVDILIYDPTRANLPTEAVEQAPDEALASTSTEPDEADAAATT